MSRHDPVAHDDGLVDELLAGRVPDDPIFAGLAAWRTSLAEMEAPPLPVAAVALAEPAAPSSLGSSCRAARHARSPRRASRVRRAAAVTVGAALLLSMGIGQAVAGSPVAPIRYVVSQAVGLGDGMASPTASDVPRSQAPSSTSATAPNTGRAEVGTLEPTDAAQKPPSHGSSGPSDSSGGKGKDDASEVEPAPAPKPGKDTDEPTTKPPRSPEKQDDDPPPASPTPPKPPRTEAPDKTPAPSKPPAEGSKPPKGGYDWWDRDDDDDDGRGWGRDRDREPDTKDPGSRDPSTRDSDDKDAEGKGTGRDSGRDSRGQTPGPVEEEPGGTSTGDSARDSSYDWIWKLLNAVD
ncbi:hypothetical protein FE697_014290 [Mumia zhuanghuii]|uniref:Uncharacterized protein n=2 Tax=Mumia TaxID=1546255 RepID=A0ABW1QQW9_9ACTN|nr:MULTISPECIES: hypothetical protein [Mumia]KAA1422325.1 hypothetical protein FE697_014290 [Mumia zhuanghuii]